MGQMFSMSSTSGVRVRIDVARSERVVRDAADRVGQLADVVRAARPDDAPVSVTPLVAGAVAAFFEERRSELESVCQRGQAVTEAAGRALAAHAAGQEEMAAEIRGNAARAGRGGL